jgi:predicted nucleotidyltransferase
MRTPQNNLLAPEQVSGEIKKAADLLARWPGVRRVWLFGSAAKGGALDGRSDLDFAVEGMAEAEEGRAWAALDEALRLPVDMVRWETANPVLKEQVVQWGKLLYEH